MTLVAEVEGLSNGSRPKKLGIARERLRELGHPALSRVAGGTAETTTWVCVTVVTATITLTTQSIHNNCPAETIANTCNTCVSQPNCGSEHCSPPIIVTP